MKHYQVEAKKITVKDASEIWSQHTCWEKTKQLAYNKYGIANTEGKLPGYWLVRKILELKLKKDLSSKKKTNNLSQPKIMFTKTFIEDNFLETVMTMHHNQAMAKDIAKEIYQRFGYKVRGAKVNEWIRRCKTGELKLKQQAKKEIGKADIEIILALQKTGKSIDEIYDLINR